MNVAAVFFPSDPEDRTFDLVPQAAAAVRAGLRLYTNGKQFALLPKPVNGWALFAAKTIAQQAPSCRN